MSNILICEDDALLAADLVMSIEAAGHSVQGVHGNATDALRAACDAKPDVAIIDLELADGHTGSAIAQRLQAMDVKVIVISGHPNVGAGLGTVPHTYAAKPVSPEMIKFLLTSGGTARAQGSGQIAHALPAAV